ncbi:MAG TPA: threonine--tRNA ligase [Patescibacteria group bacterium]|nr:threonine--tRNA ligase [Patescibacteria group bacterium]
MSKVLEEKLEKMSPEEQKLWALRHTAEHVLHTALQNLYPKLKKAMGPATSEGFYHDFDLDEKITEADFPKIEKEMQRLIDLDLPLIQEFVDVKKARDIFKGNPYKFEWVDEIEKRGEKFSLFKIGDIDLDLCSGPHVESTGKVKAFKLLSVAGAYWHGDEKNKMLTRIYGTCFPSKDDLLKYLEHVKLAKSNDHRKLGQELDLFCFSDLVGKGLVMYTPKGTIIKNELQKALMNACKEFGAMEVNIPHMAKLELYETSGHAQKFKDELFVVKSHHKEEFVLKPVNCPHHTQIYASRPRSYKDLPIAYVESTQQHRDEKPGAIGGLNRTRSFEIDDGHTFCTKEQITEEVIKLIKTAEKFYKQLNMWGNHWVSLSFRDPKTPEKYIGDEKDWQTAQKMLLDVNKTLKLNGKIIEGEAALYGPKIDIMMKDSLNNDVQLGTFQIDFAMPKRFDLKYVDQKGKEQTPIMIHRAILGSYGRFIANLLEKTGGAFPTWLSPVQVKVLPISERQIEYATEETKKLKDVGIRVELDDRNETLSAKIRDAQNEKVPYMVILGDKEIEKDEVSIRNREGKNSTMKLSKFIDIIKNEIENYQ